MLRLRLDLPARRERQLVPWLVLQRDGLDAPLQRDEVHVLLVHHLQVALDVQRARARQEGQADGSRLGHGRHHRVADTHLQPQPEERVLAMDLQLVDELPVQVKLQKGKRL